MHEVQKWKERWNNSTSPPAGEEQDGAKEKTFAGTAKCYQAESNIIFFRKIIGRRPDEKKNMKCLHGVRRIQMTIIVPPTSSFVKWGKRKLMWSWEELIRVKNELLIEHHYLKG